jgi:hypothetical protein
MNVTATTQAAGVANFASGSFTGDGTAITVALGFQPRYVKVQNVTDVETWEKHEGMAAGAAVRTVTAGTTTVQTGSQIVFGEKSMTLASAAFGSADVVTWVAFG